MARTTHSKNKEGQNQSNCCKVLENFRKFPYSCWRSILEAGKEDPRRIVHAVKVGFALTVVSQLYLLGPLFEGFGNNATWAVITVVLVLEFTVGATLSKGFNRGLGTVFAGTLALLIQALAEKVGHITRATSTGIVVFLVGFAATYVRFIPYIKQNYDYGVLIFLVTFNMLTVSNHHVSRMFHLTRDRFYTICIGCAICLCMSILILPNWSGEYLQKFTVKKLEALAKSIEACVNDYFQDEEIREIGENASRYKTVLDSKSTDETLGLFTSWEPRHARHAYPREQYLKLGTILRHFAYSVVALHGCLESEIQAPGTLRYQFKDPCIRVAAELSRVLNELAISIKNNRRCHPDVLSRTLQEALKDLNSAVESQPELFLVSNKDSYVCISIPPVEESEDETPDALHVRRTEGEHKELFDKRKKTMRPQLSKIIVTSLGFAEALPLASFISLLLEMVARLDLVIEEVEVLGRVARFKKSTKKKKSNKNVKARVAPEPANV